MIYIFTFLGEFGYELFNWQGVIRKFSRTLSPSDKIICCSRANLYPLYEKASQYIDISQVKSFQRSVACGYFALHPYDLTSGLKRKLTFYQRHRFDHRLKAELKSFILQHLEGVKQSRNPKFRWWNLFSPQGSDRSGEPYTFIFSSDKIRLNGCTFGCDRRRYGVDIAEGNIYDLLDLNNNLFQKIEPDLRVRASVEEKLGWDLTEPFVLCQTRNREIVIRSQEVVPKERLIEALAREIKVVLLSFHTGRYLDSYSAFKKLPNCFQYSCSSFTEQICLIHFARHCLFFTERDFGSHIYVPPFLGKDVTAIAPATVYQLGTTPIDFWNQNVFRFGGQIIPKVSEEVFATPTKVRELIHEILS
ncbi:MAG TPA: hypothetical protein VNM22_19240 [Candidatus Limnocylindrales bacterium]|nr:hypothetical protein [Candidatus Limnocylindrales bacterium]